MDKDTRNAIERATQRARKLLEEDFAAQLEGDFDVHRDGVVAMNAGGHLTARQAFQRERIVAAIEHKRAADMVAKDAVRDYLRDAAFTTLNRFVAVKMLEARELIQQCITKGEQSAGYREFCGMAPGLPLLPHSAGYRLYIESLFDELSTEVKVLFDRRDPSSVLWPKRATFEQLLEILNADELAGVWGEDETIGWVYQFFNGQDERRKMREESQAPRNSRELAVRNQFFTPRYVVQFLTDNTLGRIWYEMRGTNTVLAERCEYMVCKPGEEFAPRAKKDPRDLRVLDPACGSGHFLLYAFDLLIEVYEEAHADPESPKSEATGRALAEDYSSIDALRHAVPGLILAHNLHGVDIDPRCAQIAQLALWMRAQRAYREYGIGRAERRQIRRSNIVVAEPLVADDHMANEFVAKLGDAELGRVFAGLVESLKFAGDLGLLLRLETLIAPSTKRGQVDLFAPSEERIRAELTRFVNDEKTRSSARRRLFVDDAAQGIGLLAVAEKRFDVVLMNPPFGLPTGRSSKHDCLQSPSGGDMYSAFVARGLDLLNRDGRLGAITPRSFIYQLDFLDHRRDWLLKSASMPMLVELGFGELDEASNRTAAYVVEHRREKAPPTSYVNIASAATKAEKLRALCEERDGWSVASLVDAADPYTSALLFRMTPALRKKLSEYPRLDPVLGKSHRGARTGVVQLVNGLQCPEDFRFVRLHVEVPAKHIGIHWLPFLKPTGFSPYTGEVACVVKWAQRGAEQKAAFIGAGISPSKYVSGEGFYASTGVWFPDVSERGMAASLIPYPAIPGRKAILAAIPSGSTITAEALCGFMNSIWAEGLLGLITPERHHKPSYVGQIAWVENVAQDAETHFRRMVELISREAPSEVSPFFVMPDVISHRRQTLAQTADWLREHWTATQNELEDELRSFDSEVVQAVGATTDDIELLFEMSQRAQVASWFPTEHDLASDLLPQVAVDLVSYAIGRAFGHHTSGRGSELPSSRLRALEEFPTEARAPSPIVLVDDEGHEADIIAATKTVLHEYWTDSDAVLEELSFSLAPSDGNLRAWIAKSLFGIHRSRFTKSRRTAPIYWQIATFSARYSVWLYIHASNKDTLFRVQNEYAATKLAHEERRLASLISEHRDKATAAQRKELAEQEAFVEELRGFLEEVKRVAPLWNPDLDDGVIINFAPLWRLVPQNKSWQKELKATWDALCDGKYDWAHLAMHLWPERVVPKCARDRSLAIAHGLEDVFWTEGANGKWTTRKIPMRSVDELVRERTSPAVKSALKSLLEAPFVTGNGGRGRAGRGRSATRVYGGDA